MMTQFSAQPISMKATKPGFKGLRFIDFEVSGLLPGSFPIEIAWVDESRQGQSHLIRQATGWLDEARGNPAWSQESEAIHGINLATLNGKGMPHKRVDARAALVLAPVVGCSDMPQFDGFWLRTLFDVAGIRADVAMVDVSAVYLPARAVAATAHTAASCAGSW